MEDVKVSVIIPVYDPGVAILDCLNSLKRQSLQEIEMIFVDDCGTDESVSLIQEAAEKDPRIRILKNPQNMGSGHSRNRGIEAAKGEYLSFVDADDYVDKDFLKLLYQEARHQHSDIVKGSRVLITAEGSLVPCIGRTLNEKIRDGLASGVPLYRLFTYEHQSAIYSRAWIQESGAHYGSSKNAQDTTFLLTVTFGTDKIDLIESAKYFYVERKNSRTKDFSEARLKSQLLALREKKDFLIDHESDDNNKACYVASVLAHYLELHALATQRCEPVEVAMDFFAELHEMVSSLPYVDIIAKQNVIMEAFVVYKANLSLKPFEEKWGKVGFDEYLNVVHRIVDFLCGHSELTMKYRLHLWIAFGNAMNYREWGENDRESKRNIRQQLQKEVNRLSDGRVVTLPMRLFINYGIDSYKLRQTPLGNLLKSILAIGRSAKRVLMTR